MKYKVQSLATHGVSMPVEIGGRKGTATIDCTVAELVPADPVNGTIKVALPEGHEFAEGDDVEITITKVKA